MGDDEFDHIFDNLTPVPKTLPKVPRLDALAMDGTTTSEEEDLPPFCADIVKSQTHAMEAAPDVVTLRKKERTLTSNMKDRMKRLNDRIRGVSNKTRDLGGRRSESSG